MIAGLMQYLPLAWSSMYRQLCRIAGLPYTLTSWACPVCRAPSGTMGNNGAVTFGTAFPETFSGGIWCYFPADAIFTGSSAGLYWVIMSSTTAGTVYNNTYDPTASYPVYLTVSPTPFVSTGPGSYTGATAEIDVASVLVPGNAIGKNGRLLSQMLVRCVANVNSKFCRGYYGGSIVGQISTSSGTVLNIMGLIGFANRNSNSSQVAITNRGTGTGTGTSAIDTASIDSTANQYFKITLQASTATDYLILSSMQIMVTPKESQ